MEANWTTGNEVVGGEKRLPSGGEWRVVERSRGEWRSEERMKAVGEREGRGGKWERRNK